MRYRNVKNTDLNPSVIVLGTHEYGSGVSPENAFELLDIYLDAGGRLIDTADQYADWQCEEMGKSESTIGEWLKSRKVRDKIILATKGGSQSHIWPYPRLAKDELYENLMLSLERLGVDFVDLFWLHVDDWNRSVEEILDTLESFRKEGLLRYYGASNWMAFRLQEAHRCAQGNGYQGFVGSQIHWSLADYNSKNDGYTTHVIMDDTIYQYHLDTGLAQFPYTPQASGFFSGKYSSGNPSFGRTEIFNNYNLERNWIRLERAQKLAAELNCSANQIALAYLTNQPFSSFPIVGCWRIEQLLDALSAGDIVLSANQLQYLHG